MTESGDTKERGRPLLAVLAAAWVGIGFQSVENGRMWHAAACVALGVAWGVAYLWPRSAVARFVGDPMFRRKRPADR